MIQKALKDLVSGRDLSEETAYTVMEEIMEGQATPAQISAFLTALKMKGETVDEITGLARAMRQKALRVPCRVQGLLDTCGTGGDGIKTFNVSTGSAFVAAGAGVPVAKHGNRAMTSQCGSIDVLEALGVSVQLSPEKVAECIEKVGIGFLFAQVFHPAMRYAAPVRREIGFRTVFNLLGPLTNPAFVSYQVIGVPQPDLTEKMALALRNLGVVRALVVYGEPGVDELSTMGETRISEVREGQLCNYTLDARDLGFPRVKPEEVAGGTTSENADRLLQVFRGEKGPYRDLILLNSAAALLAANRAEDFRDAVLLARSSLDSGSALERLEELRRFTTEDSNP